MAGRRVWNSKAHGVFRKRYPYEIHRKRQKAQRILTTGHQPTVYRILHSSIIQTAGDY